MPETRAHRRHQLHRLHRAHHALRHSWRHSLRLRLIVLFLVLAAALTLTFIGGMQRAMSLGWRDAARPLVVDYVDHLVADLGSPPAVDKAQALVQRLPITLRISGPQVNWVSDPPPHAGHNWRRHPAGTASEGEGDSPLLQRDTADGHHIELGLNLNRGQYQPRRIGWFTLAALLLLTAGTYLYLRRLLRPLDDIRAGARRFGQGDFARPIPLRGHSELAALAADVNAMAHSLHGMLEAKRGLLLAISHELRSPLTRARLNTELLPDSGEAQPLRDALTRDLGLMRDLISDLLESERLGQGHTALHLEPTALPALIEEVRTQLDGAEDIERHLPTDMPLLRLDPSRLRLLVRNLLDNALRHSSEATHPPVISLQADGQGWVLRVRDFGPGVPDEVLPHLAEPFYRPDAARERSSGGVGLGLYLCRLVVQAHGGQWQVRNAQPGLEVIVKLPAQPSAGVAGGG